MKITYKLINGDIVSNTVNDDYQIQENETFNKPADGIYQPFSFVNGEIVGISEEDWLKSLPKKEKSDQDMISDVMQQLAVNQVNQEKINASLVQQNATLLKQINELTQKETANG